MDIGTNLLPRHQAGVTDPSHLEAARKLLGFELEENIVLALRQEGYMDERRLDVERASGCWRFGRHDRYEA